METVPEV